MMAAVAFFASCATTKKSMEETKQELFAEWTITEVKGEKAVGEDTPTLGLEEGRVYGSTGCNRYQGSMTLDGDRITFSQVAATRRYCHNALSESAILETMGNTYTYRLRKDELSLFDAQGNCVMKLRK